MFWNGFLDEPKKQKWQKRLKGAGVILQVFPNTREFKGLLQELEKELKTYAETTELFETIIINEAAEYLFFEQARDEHFVIDSDAAQLYDAFMKYLQKSNFKLIFEGGFDRKITRHPVTLAILFMLGWMVLTSLTSTMPLVSLKYTIARLWFIVAFYFVASHI